MRLGPLGTSILSLLSFAMAEQLPLQNSEHDRKVGRRKMDGFKLKNGEDILSPKKMLELPRPGAAIANKEGDMAFMVVSQYSFETKK